MNNKEKKYNYSRRNFLRQSSCASLGVTGLVNALAHMRLITASMAQGVINTDYKALVFLFMHGGNDSNNMIIPSAASTARQDYESGRRALSLAMETLHPININSNTRAFDLHYKNEGYLRGEIQPLGFHPNCSELAHLFNTGKLGVLANVGTLAQPIGTRVAYNTGGIVKPVQLFSHSDQQTQWQSSIPDRPFASGWGGRVAELLHASYNDPSASKVSMSVSLAGLNSFQVGTNGSLFQYVVQPSGSEPFSGYGTNYKDALNTDGSYKTTDIGKRLKAFEDVMRLTHANLHEEEQNRIVRRARAAEGVIGAAMTAASAAETSLGFNFNTLFAGANHSLGDQLKMIAKLIAGRTLLGNQRQIFFCQMGGFDTHQNALAGHASAMTELSTGMKAFHDALHVMGIWDNVLTCTASDFNRTLIPNGIEPTSAGNDHAWGGHALMMGGAVNGGDVYGSFPLLKTGNVTNSIDAGSSSTSRGNWIPSTSVDQYCSVMARWLGAGVNELETIFPNLPRFDNPFVVDSANLNFIKPGMI